MKTESTIIDGCEVELEIFTENGEEISQCHIIKGEYGCSLESLKAFGAIEPDDEKSKLPPRTIDKIVAWAERNGY